MTLSSTKNQPKHSSIFVVVKLIGDAVDLMINCLYSQTSVSTRKSRKTRPAVRVIYVLTLICFWWSSAFEFIIDIKKMTTWHVDQSPACVWLCLCWLRLQAAAVVQPAAWEEVPEGPGSGHLTGPASHRAHCDQRYFIHSTLSDLSSIDSPFMLYFQSKMFSVIFLSLHLLPALHLLHLLTCLCLDSHHTVMSHCSLLEFSRPSTCTHSPHPILHCHAPRAKGLCLSLSLMQKKKKCPQNRLAQWHLVNRMLNTLP